ncbi:hypothetical protein TRIP_B10080 [uncultured Desulfatiglans sp.]|uniref:Uncharacterized protein n=1 Tax=Uncultured Desulfatiglans sp. TaxID=1748965 RepID=A0A653A136_UNCDX|nr:hypothetical protein TRIP_B10080 [uncultured Desulfatiglans sp.]
MSAPLRFERQCKTGGLSVFVNRRLEFLLGVHVQQPFEMPSIRITVSRRGAIRSGTSYTTRCPLDQSLPWMRRSEGAEPGARRDDLSELARNLIFYPLHRGAQPVLCLTQGAQKGKVLFIL